MRASRGSTSCWSASATTTWRRSSTSRPPTELAKLVEADLATLLAERFDESRAAAEALEARGCGGGGLARPAPPAAVAAGAAAPS